MKLALVAELKPGLDAVNVYPAPGWVADRFEKIAPVVPVLTVLVPCRAPLPGSPVNAKVTGIPEPLSEFPDASCATTMIDGAMK